VVGVLGLGEGRIRIEESRPDYFLELSLLGTKTNRSLEMDMGSEGGVTQ
jgi:hypothetical protein